MVHLAVHLPKEAMLRGPVQYGWMYPIERRLLTCKRYVRNTARPEGSIAEAYVIDECLAFCSRYFGDVETRWNRPGRNRERSDSQSGDVSVFNHGVNCLGASQYLEAGDEYDKMVWFVLSNCAEVLPYIEYIISCALIIYIFCLGWHQPNVLIHMFCWHCRKCKEELNQDESNIHVDKRIAKGFAKWFKNHVRSLATCFMFSVLFTHC